MPRLIDVSICICTYKRPKLLEGLLAWLQPLVADNLRLQVVVVDNDPDASARAVLDGWQAQTRFPLAHLHVPEPNIARARNACVEAARGEWIAFIDDDEWPEPGWIASLVRACQEFRADIAFGPVLPVFSDPVPAWIVEGGFFERPRHATGTPATMRDARTSNALVRRDLLLRIQPPFDPAFGRTGGSDHILFGKLAAHGARMVWADDAIVHEHVSAERATLGWLLRRSLRTGQVATRARLLDVGAGAGLLRRAAIAVRSAGNFACWTAIALFRAPFSKSRSVRASLDAVSYLGRFLAVFGHRYQEYRH